MKFNCVIIDVSDARAPKRYDQFESLTSSRLLYGLGRKGGAKLIFRDQVHRIIPCLREVLSYSKNEARYAIRHNLFELLVFGDDFNATLVELLCPPYIVARFSLAEATFEVIEDFYYKCHEIEDAKRAIESIEHVLVSLVNEEIIDRDVWSDIIAKKKEESVTFGAQLDDVVYSNAMSMERYFNSGWQV